MMIIIQSWWVQSMYMPDPVLCARTGIWVHACPDIPFCAFCSSCSSLLKIYFIVYSKVHEKWPCWKKNTSYCSHGAFCVCYSQLYGQTDSGLGYRRLKIGCRTNISGGKVCKVLESMRRRSVCFCTPQSFWRSFEHNRTQPAFYLIPHHSLGRRLKMWKSGSDLS